MGIALRRRESQPRTPTAPRKSSYQYPEPRYSVIVPRPVTVYEKAYPPELIGAAVAPNPGDVIAAKIAAPATGSDPGLVGCAAMDSAQFRHYEPMPELHDDADDRFRWKFTVGPAGGVLQVMNITMCVPESAVDKPQDITIGISQNPADVPTLDGGQSLASPVIHCLPHSARFRRPVTLSFGYNPYFTETEICDLTVMCSETDLGQPTSWMKYDAGSCSFGFGDDRRCLVVLDRFCLFTVVCKDTNEQMKAKDISAMVFAKFLTESRLLNLRLFCVDNEPATMDLLRRHCVRSGYGNQVGDQPFFLYNNGKEIDVSFNELHTLWKVDGKSKTTLSFMKIWRNGWPSCLFDVTSSSDDVAPYFKCVIRVAQKDSDADQRADVDVRYEVKKQQSSTSEKRRGGVVGLPARESLNDSSMEHLLRECVDKMMKPRPDSRNSTHDFIDFKKTSTKEFVIPHKLKMELAILLNPIDSLHGHDWRQLASIMGLDDMIRHLDPVGGQTELLLTALDSFNISLERLTEFMREFGREDAAVTIEKHSQNR